VRIFVAVSGQQWLGGLTIQSAMLCRELERMGHELAVVSIGADAPVDQFPYASVRYGDPLQEWGRRIGHARDLGYVFRYEVVAHASRYIPAAPETVRRALAPAVRAAMHTLGGPRGHLFGDRGWLATTATSIYAALSGNSTNQTVEAGFLSRLLLQTDDVDLARLNEIRRWFKPDVEYACDLSLVPMLARLEDRGIPLVAAAQGFELVARRGVPIMEAIAARRHRLDLILSGSDANVRENLPELLRTLGGAVPARAIPYGVPLDERWDMSPREARAQLEMLRASRVARGEDFGDLFGGADPEGDERPFVVASLSRLDVEKGADLPLHALALLRRQGVPARLWIAGSLMPGSFLDVLQGKIRMMDLGGVVNLIGTLPTVRDKIALLRAADAFAAGFIRSEPLGLVYTEAFACGLPVIGPDSGAAPELMAHVGETRTLYPENDTGALADRIKLLYDLPDLRRALGAAEQRAFRERFNARSMAEAAAAELQRTVEARAARPHRIAETRKPIGRRDIRRRADRAACAQDHREERYEDRREGVDQDRREGRRQVHHQSDEGSDGDEGGGRGGGNRRARGEGPGREEERRKEDRRQENDRSRPAHGRWRGRRAGGEEDRRQEDGDQARDGEGRASDRYRGAGLPRAVRTYYGRHVWSRRGGTGTGPAVRQSDLQQHRDAVRRRLPDRRRVARAACAAADHPTAGRGRGPASSPPGAPRRR
jgi:glycosyltransferase involved in cell wall biosynthesis